jgi:hypothetical protein
MMMMMMMMVVMVMIMVMMMFFFSFFPFFFLYTHTLDAQHSLGLHSSRGSNASLAPVDPVDDSTAAGSSVYEASAVGEENAHADIELAHREEVDRVIRHYESRLSRVALAHQRGDSTRLAAILLLPGMDPEAAKERGRVLGGALLARQMTSGDLGVAPATSALRDVRRAAAAHIHAVSTAFRELSSLLETPAEAARDADGASVARATGEATTPAARLWPSAPPPPKGVLELDVLTPPFRDVVLSAAAEKRRIERAARRAARRRGRAGMDGEDVDGPDDGDSDADSENGGNNGGKGKDGKADADDQIYDRLDVLDIVAHDEVATALDVIAQRLARVPGVVAESLAAERRGMLAALDAKDAQIELLMRRVSEVPELRAHLRLAESELARREQESMEIRMAVAPSTIVRGARGDLDSKDDAEAISAAMSGRAKLGGAITKIVGANREAGASGNGNGAQDTNATASANRGNRNSNSNNNSNNNSSNNAFLSLSLRNRLRVLETSRGRTLLRLREVLGAVRRFHDNISVALRLDSLDGTPGGLNDPVDPVDPFRLLDDPALDADAVSLQMTRAATSRLTDLWRAVRDATLLANEREASREREDTRGGWWRRRAMELAEIAEGGKVRGGMRWGVCVSIFFFFFLYLTLLILCFSFFLKQNCFSVCCPAT